MSAVEKLIKEQSLIYALWLSQKNGIVAYIIVNVDKSKHESFTRLIEKNQPFELSDYGQIIYKGWSKPDTEQMSALNKKYGLYRRIA